MNNMKQLKAAILNFKAKRQKIAMELMKLENFSRQKASYLKKIQNYKKDYDQQPAEVAATLPRGLLQNRLNFLKKVEELILTEEASLRKIEIKRKRYHEDLQFLDNKIDLLEKKGESLRSALVIQYEKVQQREMDDLVVTNKGRRT